LPFTAPNLLAPMEGVTEPLFRELVLARNPESALGGTFTEFCRVVSAALPRRVLRAHLGEHAHSPQPVGLQLMGSDAEALAATAGRAVEVGAQLIDLNFGCPAKGALRGCAGAALLDDPARMEALVKALRRAVGAVPLSAKIRAGGEDDRRLEELARAVEAGGADLLTVHARTRREGYAAAADWGRLERAVAAVSLPVCGNGGVERHADLARLREQTGCAYAMVGRAALGDPWIFSGAEVSPAEAATFLLEYAEGLHARNGGSPEGPVRRVKQLVNHWRAGGLMEPGERAGWLRERDPQALLERLAQAAERCWPPQDQGRPGFSRNHGNVRNLAGSRTSDTPAQQRRRRRSFSQR